MNWSGRALSLTVSSVTVVFVCWFLQQCFFPHGFLPARKLEKLLLVRVTPYSFKRDNCCENFPVVLIPIRTKDEV